MAAQSVIVSFEDARRNARNSAVGRRMQAQRSSSVDKARDSHNLSNIFQLDFDDDDSSHRTSQRTSHVSEGGVPRQAIFSAEDFADDEPALSKHISLSFVANKVAGALSSRKQTAIDRAFEKQFGKGSLKEALGRGGSAGSGGSGAGPRAALYTGNMGSSQKKAARMQKGGSFTLPSFGISLPHFALPAVSATFKRNATILTLIIMAVMLFGSIYTPAQQLYQQVRERDRLTAEYNAVQARNEALQKTVDYLSTEEGLEDKAHAEFGYIHDGEKTASVIGIKPVSHVDLKANIPPGSIKAPETWYSGILDFIFLYNR